MVDHIYGRTNNGGKLVVVCNLYALGCCLKEIQTTYPSSIQHKNCLGNANEQLLYLPTGYLSCCMPDAYWIRFLGKHINLSIKCSASIFVLCLNIQPLEMIYIFRPHIIHEKCNLSVYSL